MSALSRLQYTYVNREQPLNAVDSILVIVEGNSNNLILEQLLNAFASMVETPSGIIT